MCFSLTRWPFGPLTISEQALIRIDSVKKILPSIAIAGYAIHPHTHVMDGFIVILQFNNHIFYHCRPGPKTLNSINNLNIP